MPAVYRSTVIDVTPGKERELTPLRFLEVYKFKLRVIAADLNDRVIHRCHDAHQGVVLATASRRGLPIFE